MATFYLVSQWLAQYGQFVAGMSYTLSIKLLSIYTCGSLLLMAARFPHAKGKATGIYYSAGSIATFTIPLITAKLSETSIAHIMWFDTGIAAVGFLLALFIGYRSHIASKHQLKMVQAVE